MAKKLLDLLQVVPGSEATAVWDGHTLTVVFRVTKAAEPAAMSVTTASATTATAGQKPAAGRLGAEKTKELFHVIKPLIINGEDAPS